MSPISLYIMSSARLRPEPHAPHEVYVARVVPKCVVSREKGDEDQEAAPSLEVSFEPGECLILLPEAGVHRCEIHRGRLLFGVLLRQLSQDRHRFSALPQGSVTVSEVAQLLAPSPRHPDRLLQL